MPERFRLWSATRSDWCEQEVSGPQHRIAQIERLFPHGRDRYGEALEIDVELVPEPENEHDHNAIAVCHDGAVLGYLPADVAPRWRHTINRIAASDCTAITNGRIWLHQRTEWSMDGRPSLRTSVQFHIKLPDDPNEAIPLNDPPSVPYALLPRAGIVRGTKEANYFDTLFEFVPESGYGLAYATLHRDVVETARTRRDIVTVRIDGETVAELTPAMSANFLPMIDRLNARGLTPACWADVTGSSVAGKVRIDTIKAHEASDSILDGPPVTAPTLIPAFLADWWLDINTPRAYRRPIDFADLEGSLDEGSARQRRAPRGTT